MFWRLPNGLHHTHVPWFYPWWRLACCNQRDTWLEKVFFNFWVSNVNSISDELPWGCSDLIHVPLLWFNWCPLDEIAKMADDVHLMLCFGGWFVVGSPLQPCLSSLWECVWIKPKLLLRRRRDFSLKYSRWLLFKIGFLKLWMEKEVEADHLWFKEGWCIIMQPTISSNMEK